MLRFRLLDTCLERLLMLEVGTGICLGGLGGLMLAAGDGIGTVGAQWYCGTVALYRKSDP